jgi:glycerate kinase
MRVVVAPNPFKGSLEAREVAQAMEAGVRRVWPGCDVVRVPLADGGEGTLAALVSAAGGRVVTREVTGPLGDRVAARLGFLDGGATAVVEAAQAAGLTLVPPGRLDPLGATTHGVGELIAAALDAGCRRIVVGIGGTATVDGGVGMASALGARFLDGDGRPVARGGAGLGAMRAVDARDLDPRLRRVEVIAAVDVDNPLFGPHGAARVFGPQKGATPAMVAELDAGLENLAAVVRRDLGRDLGPDAGRDRSRDAGAGAAGGLGFALMAFLNAAVRPGAEVVIAAAGLEGHLEGASLVITGEGCLDSQTERGKGPAAVARAARRAGVPVVAVVGSLAGLPDAARLGFDAIVCTYPGPVPLQQVMRQTGELVTAATEQACRLVAAGAALARAGRA